MAPEADEEEGEEEEEDEEVEEEEEEEEEEGGTSFPTGPPTHEVQACSDRCDFPCTKLKPCKWDKCHILRSYAGGKEVDLLIEGEVYHSILSRHVRPLNSSAPDAENPPKKRARRAGGNGE